MKKRDRIIVTEKKNTVWIVLGVILAVAGLCAIGYLIYKNYKKKALQKEEEASLLDAEDELDGETYSDTFEVSANSVIEGADAL